MRLTKFNEETGNYELIKKAKTQEEFMAQRKAVIQRLGEFEDKASDVAEEIFAEINELKKQYASGDINGNELYVQLYLLEKKYTEE